MQHLEVPQGRFALARYPVGSTTRLRAWDAADEYLLADHAERLEALAGEGAGAGTAPGNTPGHTVVLNIGSGALAVALAQSVGGASPAELIVVSDSFVDRKATGANLAANGLASSSVRVVSRISEIPTGPIGCLLIKVPKTLSLLEEQLYHLRSRLDAQTTIVAGAMTKHLHTSTLELFERLLGPTTTTRAVRKARLAHVRFDPDLAPADHPWPVSHTVDLGQFGSVESVQHANVFSAGRLDPGTRAMLDALVGFPEAELIVDLGCGDGILGARLALQNPQARVVCVDESTLAVESATATLSNAGVVDPSSVDDGRVRAVVANGLFEVDSASAILEPATVDVVVCNPPFHDDHALSDQTAWQMFTESRTALVPGGELWVVGNRHLAYHAKLKRIFGNCSVVASNSRFVVYRATKSVSRRQTSTPQEEP